VFRVSRIQTKSKLLHNHSPLNPTLPTTQHTHRHN
jgi:hypothetical protein